MNIHIMLRYQVKKEIIILYSGDIEKVIRWKNVQKCGSKYGDNNSNYCIDCGSRLFDLNSSKKPTSNIGKHKKRGQYKTGDYARDLRIAEELYKIYDKNSVARLDNVNGHLLAAQTRKMDILIEQNNRIISLLEKITNKP